MVAIGIYLDTSVIGALLIPEPLTERAEKYFANRRGSLQVSDLSGAEFASLVARRVRTGEFTMDQAMLALSNFDAWRTRSAVVVEAAPEDVSAAAAILRRLDLPLRTLDAIHIAIARRLDATVVTFDRQMAASCRMVGATAAEP